MSSQDLGAKTRHSNSDFRGKMVEAHRFPMLLYFSGQDRQDGDDVDSTAIEDRNGKYWVLLPLAQLNWHLDIAFLSTWCPPQATRLYDRVPGPRNR